MRSRRSANIAAALENLLGGMESSTRIRENLAIAYWARIVGPQAAAATEPDSVKEGVLFVRTKSSVWSHELTFLKSAIIERLNQRIGRPVIREIIFRAQGVKKAPPVEAQSPPTEEELRLVALGESERRRMEGLLRKTGRIADERIRERVRKRIIREARLARWRLDHGWTECEECESLHPTGETVCPMCRIGRMGPTRPISRRG